MYKEKEVFERLIKEYQGEDLAGYLTDSIRDINCIRNTLHSISCTRQRLLKEYEEALQELKKDELSIQKHCLHYSTTYFGDPAGGNDSWTQCDICGASV